MKSLIGICFVIASVILVEGQQRVAPGVPPQQYQQQYAPPPPQHQQMPPPQQQMPNQVPQMQQQVQYQQVPVQQHQVPQQHIPVQQQQIPVQQQQIPVQPQQGGHPQGGHPQGGHGHAHGHQQQLLNTANIMQEKQHIQEHIDIPIDVSKMTEQELQFHYFKMHDSDRNDKLDGCELIKSLIHWHEQGHKDPNNPNANQEVQQKIFTDDELVALIDPIMKMDDTNNDGFIDYPEFIRAQNKAAAGQQRT